MNNLIPLFQKSPQARLLPRPYQSEAIEKVETGFKEFSRQLAVAPTGCGKTVIFAWLAERRLPQRTLILAHRDELIDQAISKIAAATGIAAGREKAEDSASLQSPIVVASVQTMIRRLERWPRDHFGLVVADEAHHAISDSWQKVLTHFSAQVLGVTATPDRGDKRSLGVFFENVAIDIPLVQLIREEYLCPITIKCVPLEIDLRNVHLLAGDFSDQELGHVLEPYLDTIAQAVYEHAGGRKILAFLPLIDTSMKFVRSCNDAGLIAHHVDGGSLDRKEILERFAGGAYNLLSNAMLLTEGYDDPTIDCIVVLRPTKSRPLFAQMIGRGTRIAPTKKDLLILDLLWLHERHRVVHPADLLAQDEEEADEITALAAERSEAGADMSELDLMALSEEVARERAQRLAAALAAQSHRKPKFISAEEFCLRHDNVHAAYYQPTMRWETKPVTEAQAKYLAEAQLDLETVQDRGHASVLLDIIFREKDLQPATPKQKWVMRNKGYPNVDKATRADARRFFAELNKQKENEPF